MACPMCGCDRFYVKDPSDDFEIHEFGLKHGEAIAVSEDGEERRMDIRENDETYCNNCAWHGKWKELN